MEPTTLAPTAPVSPTVDSTVDTTVDTSVDRPAAALLEDELLVEEISIDGMCGVY